MSFRVLVVGKPGGNRWADAAVADYTKRLRRLGGIEEKHVKQVPFKGDIERVRDEEADRLLKRLSPRDVVVAMDERGDAMTSESFADWLDEARQQGGDVVFVIGGAYGHGKALRDRANKVLRLSTMVLNHEIARVVLYEQVYRAMTLIRGIPYHH